MELMISHRNVPTLLTPSGDNMEWTQIECGVNHTAAVTKEGVLLTWGYNVCGKLGHGDQKSSDTPTRVAKLDGLVITHVSCGEYHMAALSDKGEAFTW